MSGRALIALSFAALLFASARADEARSTAKEAGVAAFSEGARLLAAGKDARPAFQRAQERFRKTTNDVLPSTGTGQNLGNAAFLAGDLPYAVAAFRAGLILDPHQPVLRTNLDYARAQVQYPPGQRGRPEADSWPPWLPRWHAATLLGFGAVAYSAAWLAGTAWWFRRRTWLSGIALAAFALAACAGYGWWLHLRQAQLDRASPPIVIRNDTPLLTGNGPSYPRQPDLPMLRRGMEARRLGERGGWWQIRFASGETGWIHDADAWLIALTDEERPAVSIRAGRDIAAR